MDVSKAKYVAYVVELSNLLEYVWNSNVDVRIPPLLQQENLRSPSFFGLFPCSYMCALVVGAKKDATTG